MRREDTLLDQLTKLCEANYLCLLCNSATNACHSFVDQSCDECDKCACMCICICIFLDYTWDRDWFKFNKNIDGQLKV